ncbi:hypothetical protein PUNSTDRAFT_49337 [Punctularia strigosozonata HHB-11173 SS5]|uniref:uncharacterized protein n=1 Tax=Punctularia strigosozonata (strain HHB-11173) TaxID=741275 RepID=UPI0004416C68|nr:uncharacterized protein PUNSTDRAFT_49337 [Punctularia strigosozonata HHB-11173 SS5]EIN14610.1 hypothetical protein PUNSTDRAFT_49337 [Punctularia strigosozonata HHB-11173 SS5]
MPASATQYIAACNPPRRAKRARTTLDISSPEAPSDSAHDSDWVPARPQQQQQRILPRPPSSPSGPASGAGHHADEPSSAKRRGRKPGSGSGMSRSARESMRKQNHSRIEKARRTKINDALAALRVLVPKRADDASVEDAADGVQLKKTKSKGKEGEEKEFKLEILIRTVAYMEELIDRVRSLEEGRKSACDCGGAARGTDAGSKRKRARDHDDNDDDEPAEDTPIDILDSSDDELADDEGDPRCDSVRYGSALSSVASTPRLPPIASWMPLPPGHVDPSALSLPPSHLPTPPLSAPMPPKVAFYAPPVLSLPPPNLHLAPPGSGAVTMSRGSSTREEDDEAASALLQIRSLSSPTSPVVSVALSAGFHAAKSREGLQAQTPSALLGLALSRAGADA